MSSESEATVRELQTSIMRYQELETSLVKSCETFSKRAVYSEIENRRLLSCIEQLKSAINDEGPNPRYHNKIMKKHRRDWPVLWEAIDRLVKDA